MPDNRRFGTKRAKKGQRWARPSIICTSALLEAALGLQAKVAAMGLVKEETTRALPVERPFIKFRTVIMETKNVIGSQIDE